VDLKKYFQKIREIEASISDAYPVVVSLETPDGGKPGVSTEVPRYEAARMIAEGCAVLASEEEKELYRQARATAKQAIEAAELTKRVQVAIIADPNLQNQFSNKKGNSPSANGK
jgi:hypothetical protein